MSTAHYSYKPIKQQTTIGTKGGKERRGAKRKKEREYGFFKTRI